MKFTIAALAALSVATEARFMSGAVTGYEKFTYGKFITRMKAPNKLGTVSSFFTYWNGPDFNVGGWNELDVEIVPSVAENPFSMNIIYGDGHEKRESHDYVHGFNPADDWHIYELVWTPEYVAWSLDGKEVRRVTPSDPAVHFMSKGQSVMMNFWTPTFDSWGHGFDAADMPWEVLYDYVETYTYNSHTKGFDFHWKDDFNTFDSNKWHKSDNTTFDANSTTFRASQAFVRDGTLVLKMEPDVHHSHKFDHSEPHVTPVMTEPTAHHQPSFGGLVHPGDSHYDVAQAVAESQHHYLEEHHHEGEFHEGDYGSLHYYPTSEHAAYGYHHGESPEPVMVHYTEHSERVPHHYTSPHAYEHAREVYPVEHHHGDAELAAPHHPHFETHHYSYNGEENNADVADDWHRAAHMDQHYWTHVPHKTASVFDQGHFRAEEHGEYHYVSPEETGHHGLYYSYGDAREFTPHHVDEYHDAHGVEHHPDDWIEAKPIHDTLFSSLSHFHHNDRADERALSRLAHAHSYASDDFNHDATYHSGTELKRDIELEYDDLYHALEAGVRHGIEHHDVETLTKVHEEHP